VIDERIRNRCAFSCDRSIVPYQPVNVVHWLDDLAAFIDARRRGYATTLCAILPHDMNMAVIWASNDIPDVCVHEYASTPRGVERKPKFTALGHAERIAIEECARRGLPTRGAALAVNWFPCLSCAHAIGNAGIARVIARPPDDDYQPDSYDFPAARKVLADAGVDLTLV